MLRVFTQKTAGLPKEGFQRLTRPTCCQRQRAVAGSGFNSPSERKELAMKASALRMLGVLMATLLLMGVGLFA
jgi:hypothetical protein